MRASCFLIWLALMTWAVADPASVRVAVISDAENKDLAALVTTELSSHPDITLVERDDLAKVGDELKLQQLAGSDAVSLGKLIGADGLLLLDKNGVNLKVRFTAVGLGFVLFDLQIPPGLSPDLLAKSLSARVALFVSKLKLSPDKAIPLSLLNFRSELASSNSEETEHQLTLLLESRLAAVPEYVVLERRHADALGFEHSVLAPTPPELLNGAYLIDGSFRPVGINASWKIVVSLRVRSPRMGRETTLNVEGSEKDLPALVKAMADKIGQEIGSTDFPVAWQPQDEAKEYMREAHWAWQHSTDKDTLEALNNAELLGDTDRDLHLLRIHVLCEMDKPEAEHRSGLGITPPPLEERVDLIRQAMRELLVCHAMENPPNLGPPGQASPGHWESLDDRILGPASDLLQDLEASPLTELTDSFRQELRTFIGFDPLHGKVPRVNTAMTEVNADDLANSADEEIAFLINRLTKGHVLEFGEPANFCPRFCKTPADRKAAFDKFMQELQAEPKGRLPWLAISCYYADTTTLDSLYPQLLQELWNKREELFKCVAIRHYMTVGARLNADVRKKYIEQSLPLFHYWLSNPEELPSNEMTDFLHLEWYSPDDIDGIWNDLQKQKAALLAQGTEAWNRSDLRGFEAAFFQIFPSRRPPDTDATLPRLTVNRFWSGRNVDEPDPDVDVVYGYTGQRSALFQLEISPDGSGVWGLLWRFYPGGKASGIVEIHLPDMATKFIDTNCGRPIHAVRTSNAYYVTYADYGGDVRPVRPDEYYVKRYDLDSRTWTQRRASGVSGTGEIEELDDQLYLSLQAVWQNGLEKYDWDTDKLTILASSRRKPALNQFDDRGDYGFSLFVGPGNKPCVLGPGGIYYVQEEPGPWTRVPFDIAGNAIRNGHQTLIRTIGGEAVLIDPDKPAPIPLVAPSEPANWRPVPGSNKMKKQLPAWASQAVWKYRPEWGDFGNVAYHDGHLYHLFQQPLHTNYYELLVFNPGQTSPVIIPLRFLFKGSEETADKILRWMGNVYTPYAEYDLIAADQGICLKNDWGFWFVPYADIEAYEKSNPNQTHTP